MSRIRNKTYHQESKYLDEVSKTYVDSRSPYGKYMKESMVEIFIPYLNKNNRILELGCSDGYSTCLLSKHVNRIDVLEGSMRMINKAKQKKMHNVNFIHSLFEEYKPVVNKQYDCVLATYVLEHVMDVGSVLSLVKRLLKPGGLFFCVVPNANALSRQLALQMKLIKSLKELTPNDLRHGHRRVYDTNSLILDLQRNEFRVIKKGGIVLKILADFQLDELIRLKFLGKSQLEGLNKLGNLHPTLCGSLYVICKLTQR